MIKCKAISGLEKILLGTPELPAKKLAADVVAQGEIYSFQVAITSDVRQLVRVELQSDLNCRVRQVGHVPVLFPGSPLDTDVLNGNRPGLYPDVLNELDNMDQIRLLENSWQTLWITVYVGPDQQPGDYPVTVKIFERNLDNTDWKKSGKKVTVKLAVQNFQLPPQKMIRFEWFHPDCLANFYQVESWSEAHWQIVENFARNAYMHGINMLYTPLWTPPLDTAIGHARTTCQLLDIVYDKKTDKYQFDFSKLRRFFAMGKRIGFKHFSMTHLFSQWGAAKTPRIVAQVINDPDHVDGMYAIFGWGKDSTGPEYRNFLEQLMPQLLNVIRSEKLDNKHCYFSLSDEPSEQVLDTYRKVVALARPLLEEYETVEALSHYDFYAQGLVQNAVPSIGVIEDFKGRTKSRWAYYCCGPALKAPNRFISMPSRRTRTFGLLAYLYDLEGFLHWGFNFYYAQYSLRQINPFSCTDAGGAFPGGDAFLVYPGPNGDPLDSIRHEMFFAGLQDMRALQLLETKIGRPAVEALIQQGRKKPVKMMDFPNTANWLTDKRKAIYAALAVN